MSTNRVDQCTTVSALRSSHALVLFTCLVISISPSCSRQQKTSGNHAKEPAGETAPVMPRGAMTLSAVLKRIETAGYSPVVEVEFEKDHWEIKAHSNGRLLQIDVDPVTGAVIPSTTPKNDRPLSEVVKTLEDQGYGPILDVEREGEEAERDGLWEVESYKGKSKTKIRVNSATGEIIAK